MCTAFDAPAVEMIEMIEMSSKNEYPNGFCFAEKINLNGKTRKQKSLMADFKESHRILNTSYNIVYY